MKQKHVSLKGFLGKMQKLEPLNLAKCATVGELVDVLFGITACTKPVEREASRLRPVNSEVMALLADSSRLAADAGWAPRINLRDGLARTVEWWKERLALGHVRREASVIT